MADFDNSILQQEQDRMAHLEIENQNLHNHFQQMANESNYLRNQVQRPPPQISIPPRKNIPPPPMFSGIPPEISSFKLRICQFLGANYDTHTDTQSQILYASSLLSGMAGQWYELLVDPYTLFLPPSYTLDSILQELDDFLKAASPFKLTSAP